MFFGFTTVSEDVELRKWGVGDGIKAFKGDVVGFVPDQVMYSVYVGDGERSIG